MKNRDFIYKNRYLWPILIIIFFILTFSWITNNGVIIFYGDSLKQQIPFYSGLWEKVHTMNLGFWDWSMIFGTNSYAQTFYCHLNNPYLYIILLFPKEWIPQIYTLTNLLKVLLTYISAYWWLKKINRSETAAISGALIVSFSAWFLTMYEWGHLLDVFPLYFVLFLLVDEFIMKNKKNLLVIVIAFMTIINYYLSYMFLPFLMIYTLYRLYVLTDQNKIKSLVFKLVKMFGLILLGVMISGFVLLPSAYIVLKTPRIIETQNIFVLNFDIVYRIITSIFLPPAYRLEPNILTSLPGVGWYGGVSLFTSFLAPICFVLFARLEKSKEKKALSLMIVFFLIATCFPIIYRVLQGTLETRWFYMFSIIVALIVSYTLDNLLFEKIKYNFVGVFVILSGLLGAFYIYSNANNIIVNKERFFILIFMYLFFTCVYILFLYKISMKIIILILVIESTMMFANGLYIKGIVDHENINTVEYEEVIMDLKLNDSGFYRVLFSQQMLKNNASLDEYNYILANLPYSYDVMGTSGYSSLYSFDQDRYLKRYKEDWTVYQPEGRIFVNQVESIKYWIANTDEIPPYGFSYLKSIKDKVIYINDNFIELGYYTESLINENNFENLPILKQDMLLTQYVTILDNGTDEYELTIGFDSVDQWVDPNYYEYNKQDNKDDKLFLVENFYMNYLDIILKKEGNTIFQKKIYQKDYLSLYLPQTLKYDQIVIMVDQRAIYDSGINVGYINNFSDLEEIFDKNKEQKLYRIVFDNDRITAEYYADSDKGIVYTSIPYDDGWTISINGNVVEKMKVNMGFIGFKPIPGENHITFDYVPPLQKEGVYLSLIGLLMLFVVNINFKKIVKTSRR